MDIKFVAKQISDISRKEVNLLYYSSEELEKALAEGRAVYFEENGKLAAFGAWSKRADCAELHALYIYPEFRGKGYLRKIFQKLYEAAKQKGIKVAYFFTQAPEVVHVAGDYGFKPTSHASLPNGVFGEIIWHRIHPKRWFSYLKYLSRPAKLFGFKVYIAERI